MHLSGNSVTYDQSNLSQTYEVLNILSTNQDTQWCVNEQENKRQSVAHKCAIHW